MRPAAKVLLALLVLVALYVVTGLVGAACTVGAELADLEARVAAAAARYTPTGAADIRPYGESVEGRPLTAWMFSRGADGPVLLVTAGTHGVEAVSVELALALADALAGESPASRAVLSRADVVLFPLVNPDGLARVAEEHGLLGMKGARTNAHGVDLNRNFGAPEAATTWNAASEDPASPYFRGEPLAEPESRALRALFDDLGPSFAVHLHSFGAELFVPTPAGERAAADKALVETFVRALHEVQARDYPVVWEPEVNTGTAASWGQHARGVPGVTFEIGAPDASVLLPWRFVTPYGWTNPREPATWIQQDRDALLAALAALAEAIHAADNAAAPAPSP